MSAGQLYHYTLGHAQHQRRRRRYPRLHLPNSTATATPTATATATATSTATATPTATATATATPTSRLQRQLRDTNSYGYRYTGCVNYTFSVGSGSIVPGTTDTGNHTDDGSTVIALPFSYQMYDTSFANVAVGSNGHLTFGTVNNAFNPTCIPIVTATYAIFPYETDQCTGPCTGVTGTTYGIFTSTSGVAPNRIFNIEYRTAYYNSGGAGIPLNYEVRLYEGQTAFDVIYGTVPATFTPPAARNLSVGAQRTNATQFVLEGCDTTGGGSPPVSAGQLYHYTLGVARHQRRPERHRQLRPRHLRRQRQRQRATATATRNGDSNAYMRAAAPAGPGIRRHHDADGLGADQPQHGGRDNQLVPGK